jgi:hypothetical protein
MSEDSGFKLRYPVWSRGSCKHCGRKGDSLSGVLMNFGVSRSASPTNVSVMIGPFCKNHGGRLKVELELMQKIEELS